MFLDARGLASPPIPPRRPCVLPLLFAFPPLCISEAGGIWRLLFYPAGLETPSAVGGAGGRKRIIKKGGTNSRFYLFLNHPSFLFGTSPYLPTPISVFS